MGSGQRFKAPRRNIIGRSSGTMGLIENDHEGWGSYSADEAKDFISWEGIHFSSRGGWSINIKDSGATLARVECLPGSIPVYGTKHGGRYQMLGGRVVSMGVLYWRW